VCARKNEENEEMKIKGNKILIQKRLDERRPRVTSGTSDCELLTTVLWPSKLVSLSRSYAARRRVWRMVGVGMRLLRHDREVEGVVVEDDAVLVVKLMNSWGFASREGVFAETKEGICRNKNFKNSFEMQL